MVFTRTVEPNSLSNESVLHIRIRFFKVSFKIGIPSTARSPKMAFCFRMINLYSVCVSGFT
jgi:hypothetical protein